jgi:hypothetical protein
VAVDLFREASTHGSRDAVWLGKLQLTSKGWALDARGLVEILDEDPDRVERWLNRDL